MRTEIVEFQDARMSWDRWHDHAASESEQRAFGRRWRWTALWEMIWDDWIEYQRGSNTLSEFVEALQRFWMPLRPRLDDASLYDPAIEIIWQRALADGPATLISWPQVVHETWAAMSLSQSEKRAKSTAAEATNEPTIKKTTTARQTGRVKKAVGTGKPGA